MPYCCTPTISSGQTTSCKAPIVNRVAKLSIINIEDSQNKTTESIRETELN